MSHFMIIPQNPSENTITNMLFLLESHGYKRVVPPKDYFSHISQFPQSKYMYSNSYGKTIHVADQNLNIDKFYTQLFLQYDIFNDNTLFEI